mgnify:CR=1 FL=1
MIDKILSVKASAETMTFFMAMHILIMASSGGDNAFYAMIFIPLALVSGSIFYMNDDNARRALLALGAGWMPTVFYFTYGWGTGELDTDDLPPIPGMVMWWVFMLQAILVGSAPYTRIGKSEE